MKPAQTRSEKSTSTMNTRSLAALLTIVMALFCCRFPAAAQSEQEKVEAAK